MADTPTQRDLFLAGREEAILSPTRFDRAIIDTVGSDINVVLNVAASMGEELARYMQTQLNALSLSTAFGEALDRWVFDNYQLTRKEASVAVVYLTLTRSGTDGVTIPKGSKFGTQTGINFVTQTDVSFPEFSLGPLEVLAIAEQTGTGGNVAEELITQVITPSDDPTVEVTNLEPASGGNDQENDDELKIRAREFFLNARRGTKEAIEFGALQSNRVAQATATEYLNTGSGLPGYRVQLNIADSAGQANTALAQDIVFEMDEYRALGIPVLVLPSVPQYVKIRVTGLQFTSGANTTQVLQNALNALMAEVNSTEPGATLYRSDLLKTLSAVNQLIVPEGALVEPAGDLVPLAGSVIRTTKDRIELNP